MTRDLGFDELKDSSSTPRLSKLKLYVIGPQSLSSEECPRANAVGPIFGV